MVKSETTGGQTGEVDQPRSQS